MRDKAVIIRRVKLAEIGIMLVGATGLLMAWQGILTELAAIPLMLLALFAMGIHSTFFGPIKYAILPQHLKREEVLSGTGLVEGGHLHRHSRRHYPGRLHPGGAGRGAGDGHRLHRLRHQPPGSPRPPVRARPGDRSRTSSAPPSRW